MKSRTNELAHFHPEGLQFLSAVAQDAARSATSANTVKAYLSSISALRRWLVGRELTDQSFSDYLGHVHANGRAPLPFCRYNRAGP